VPLVALLAGAGIAVAAVSGLAGAPPAPVAAEDADAPLVLVAGDYVGRPADEVEAELGGLGLRVERVSAETTAADPGLVTALGPTGAVAAGELISVTVAVAPVAVPEPAPPAPPAAPAAPASPVASVPDAVAEVPAGTGRNGDWTGDEGDDADDDDGNGNGNGNGKAWGKGNGNGKGNGGRGNDD
jgi:serine/threonine-protein kinase